MRAPDRQAGPSMRRSQWRPLAALAVAAATLNFIWEMLVMALYQMPNARVWSSIVGCVWASAGDVAITVGAYAAVALATHDRRWGDRFTTSRLAGYVATGLAVTIVLEVSNVYLWHRWDYAPGMPLVLGIGMAPLTQWVVVPVLSLLLARRADEWWLRATTRV